MNRKMPQIKQYRLEGPGHASGVSCDSEGPALGPIRFLVRTAAGLEPRSVEELNGMIGWTLGRPTDCSHLLPGLRTVSRALNSGELARAMIATQFLPLPALDRIQARRAADVAALFKAAVDDPKHPGFPAGSPNREGGEFRPKDGTEGSGGTNVSNSLVDARRIVGSRLERQVARRALRKLLRSVLT